MRLRATVRTVTGNTTHVQGVRHSGDLEVTPLPDPKTVEIVEQEGAIYLLRLDDRGACVADTWHETVEAAKAQAYFELGIEDGDWKDVEPNVTRNGSG
jgi:hypothetical protein